MNMKLTLTPLLLLLELCSIIFLTNGLPTSANDQEISPEEVGGDFEGDIVIPALASSGLVDQNQRWPNAEIIYVIDSAFTQAEKNIILSAMTHITEKTCVKFSERKSEAGFIRIRKGRAKSGCHAIVGYWGVETLVNLESPGCLQMGIVAHELLHTMGFFHEQSRSDRDQFVEINEGNVLPLVYQSNFKKLGVATVTHFGLPYDYKSIMHYGYTYFAIDRNKPTIKSKDPATPTTSLGQRDGLSKMDVQKIRRMFNITDTGCDCAEFACKNSKCVRKTWICDNENDCGDLSDEVGCDQISFNCTNGKSVPSSSRCNCVDDCGDWSDEKNCQKAPSEKFRCKNNLKCIHINYKCDNEDDCGDGSDETPDTCGGNQFKCASGLFTLGTNRCNCVDDCGDWSDEKNCQKAPSDKFRCKNNLKCIHINYKCDNEADCGDESDEKSCDGVMFKCTNGKSVPSSSRCNCVDDCGDWSDEKNCQKAPSGKFRCKNNLKCIHINYKCDNEDDCGDESDEKNCDGVMFNCTNGTSISSSSRCNCVNDCGDGSDEKNCQKAPTGKFRCTNKKCVSINYKCDNEDDCGDGSEEKNCDGVMFSCANGKSVSSSSRCNCVDDCGDGSDEKNCIKAPTGKFRCTNKKCVNINYKCDKDDDCGDGSDELNCPSS